MLLADIHGKIVPEAQGNEDYLTSAVFGHLRYISPRYFWRQLFAIAKSSIANGSSLADVLWSPQNLVDGYSELSVQFWYWHDEFGEPDLVLRFTGKDRPVHYVLVEAKLWSGKSGTGENDQLVRYLHVLDELPVPATETAGIGSRCLLYLTPRDSTDEIEDSLKGVADPDLERRRIFRLQWQDILDVARRDWPDAAEPTRMILRDVALFLQRRGLEYFRGFRSLPTLLPFETFRPAFFKANSVFVQTPISPLVAVQKAGWING